MIDSNITSCLLLQGAVIILQEFAITQCDIWFMKLGVCIPLNIFALGNMAGKVRSYSVLIISSSWSSNVHS
jgi:hypothetical protein